MTLTEFLLARISDQERAATTSATLDASLWDGLPTEGPIDLMALPDWDITMATIDHVRRNQPGRVLAECSAKRQILAECGSDEFYMPRLLRFLAQPYADHPDFDASWTVTE